MLKRLTRTRPANYTLIRAILIAAGLLMILLAACGDATSTIAPATIPPATATLPATTVASTTAPAPTVLATTTEPATTVAATTVPATTVASTTAPASTVAVTTAPAKATPVSTGPVSAKIGTLFQLRINQTALIGSDKLEIKFLRVIEDSRCPSNVNCAWSGQTIIEVAVSKNGQTLGNFKLNNIEAYKNKDKKTFEDYSLTLTEVQPTRIYSNFGTPNASINEIKPEDYVVGLMLTKLPTGTPTIATAKAGSAFDLKINQTVLIEPDNFEVKFLRVVEDSRCPVSSDSSVTIACYASGPVRIEVTVSKNGQLIGNFNLSSSEAYNNKDKKLFENYALTLVKVQPERIQDNGGSSKSKVRAIAPEEYVVSLLATKLG